MSEIVAKLWLVDMLIGLQFIMLMYETVDVWEIICVAIASVGNLVICDCRVIFFLSFGAISDRSKATSL